MSGSVEKVNDQGLRTQLERFVGKEYLHPLISCGDDGYQFSNLNLPQNWRSNIPELLNSNFDEFFINHSGYNCLVNVDQEIGLITRVQLKNIHTQQQSETRLVCSPDNHQAEYQGEIINLGDAIAHQELLAPYLSYVSDYRFHYSSMVRRGFTDNGPDDLFLLPKELLRRKNPVTDKDYRTAFIDQAHNFAHKFGVNIESVEFTENGVLRKVLLKEGDQCFYKLNDNGLVSPNNVDHENALATLHGIFVMFINEMITKYSHTDNINK